MTIRHTILAGLFVPVILIASASAASGKKAGDYERRYYRYVNAEGILVIDDRIPVEHAGQGYEVINIKGEVLEVIARQLTAEEKAAQAEEVKVRAAELAAKEESKERDERLMLRYSSIEDIEAAKSRALGELDIRIGILKSNRVGLKSRMDALQAQAADIERRGQKVSLDQLKVMDDLRIELLNTEQSVRTREQEKQQIAAGFDSDIARFDQLLELVELRRQNMSGER